MSSTRASHSGPSAANRLNRASGPNRHSGLRHSSTTTKARSREACAPGPTATNWLSQAPRPMAARKVPTTTPVARAASPAR
ncbi:hypothetical protein [Cyanobium sp. NIES-981]|uniref:hypothetical protein n=1 Tax=Cyanobium sp. NIES-981 TaxID=1851505 RepID=UPI001CED75B7|nr:hypothetical protein [Cyanobium sp. NIES-981]